MGKSKSKPLTRPSMAERLGWPRCHRPCHLRAAYAFGEYDGPAVVVAVRPATEGHPEPSAVVVEFDHPASGRRHQATACTSEVTYAG